MVTIRAGNAAIWIFLLTLTAGCSREQQDWRAAEAADSVEAYGHFIQRHPDSELVNQARMRVAELGEDRDWQHAGSADTVDAYREFLQLHPNGKWAQEARIRIENFSLSEQAGTDAGTRHAASTGAAQTYRSGAPSDAAAKERAGVAPTLATTQGADGPSPATAQGPIGTAPASAVVQAPGSDARGAADVQRPAGPASGSTSSMAAPGEAAVPLGSGSGQGALPRASSGSTQASAVPGGSNAREGDPSAATARPRVSGEAAVGGGVAVTNGSRPLAVQAGAFGIQLGAFTSESAASAQWRTLMARFGPQLQGLQQHIVPADTPSGRIYRLQALVGPEARARGICELLRTQSQDCVAVLPH